MCRWSGSKRGRTERACPEHSEGTGRTGRNRHSSSRVQREIYSAAVQVKLFPTSQQLRHAVQDQAHQSTHQRPVDSDELQVPPNQ